MEMNIIKVTKENSTGNKKLDSCINKINSEFSRGIKASHEIARQLQKIRDEELYTATGAESFSEFSEKWFNMSRSQTSRLASISERFLHEKIIDAETGKEVYVYEDFTTSKLVEMLKATDEQLALITSDMTVKEIHDFISGKAIEDNTNDSDTDSDTESDIESDTESDTESTGTDLAMAVQALKDRIRNAISYINTSDDDMFAEDAFNEVLEWIDELF